MKNYQSILKRNITSDIFLQSTIKKTKTNTNITQNYLKKITSTQTNSNFFTKKFENKENFNSNSIKSATKKQTNNLSKKYSSLSKDNKNFTQSKLNSLNRKKLIEKCNIKYNYNKIKVNKKQCNNNNHKSNRPSSQTRKNNNSLNSIRFKNLNNEKTVIKIKKIVYIQQWWKNLYKIIFLQKHIKSYLSHKKYLYLKKLKKFVKKINYFFYNRILKILSSDNCKNIKKKKEPSSNARENERKTHKRVFSFIPHTSLIHSNINNNNSTIINMSNNISNLQELFNGYFTKKNNSQSRITLKYNSNKSFNNINNNNSGYFTNNFYPIKINQNIIFRNSANNTINSINTFNTNNNSRFNNSFLINDTSSSNKSIKLDMKFEPVKYLIKCKRNFNHWKNITVKKKILKRLRFFYLFNKFVIKNYYKIFYDKFKFFYRINYNLIADLQPTDNTTSYSNNITYDLYSIKNVKIKKIISNKIYILSFIINMIYKMNNKHLYKHYLKKWKKNSRTIKHIDSKIIRFAKSPSNNNRIKLFEENPNNNNIKIINNKIVYQKKNINFPKNKNIFENNIIKRKVNRIEEREINFSPRIPRKTFEKINNTNNNNEDARKKNEMDRGKKIIIQRMGGFKDNLGDYFGKSYSQNFFKNKSDIFGQ